MDDLPCISTQKTGEDWKMPAGDVVVTDLAGFVDCNRVIRNGREQDLGLTEVGARNSGIGGRKDTGSDGQFCLDANMILHDIQLLDNIHSFLKSLRSRGDTSKIS